MPCGLGLEDSVPVLAALDFDLVGGRVDLRTKAEGVALQGEVDEVHGLPGLLFGGTVRDLVGVELKVEPVDGDGLHAWSGLTKAKAASLFFRPMTRVIVGETGRVNTTLQIVFTQP